MDSIDIKKAIADQISKLLAEKVFHFAHEPVRTSLYHDCTVVTATYNGPEDQHDVLMDKTSAYAFIRDSGAFAGKYTRIEVDHDEDLNLTDLFLVISDEPVDPFGRF